MIREHHFQLQEIGTSIDELTSLLGEFRKRFSIKLEEKYGSDGQELRWFQGSFEAINALEDLATRTLS